MERVAEATIDALQRHHEGDILVFLPGVGEIRSVESLLLRELSSSSSIRILPLHGNLPPEQQDEVVQGGAKGRGGGVRRVVLSTNLAESSVTIDGVRVVVDSGYRRSPAYDLATGVNRLCLQRISKASADQRAGRAGRQAPGVCYRLWDEDEDMMEATPPEIHEADLAPAVLQCSCWGATDALGLPWLDPPEEGRVSSAIGLLTELGALDERKKALDEGRRMARLGVHPRFAHLVLRGGEDLAAPELSALLAALLSERDIFRGGDGGNKT